MIDLNIHLNEFIKRSLNGTLIGGLQIQNRSNQSKREDLFLTLLEFNFPLNRNSPKQFN